MAEHRVATGGRDHGLQRRRGRRRRVVGPPSRQHRAGRLRLGQRHRARRGDRTALATASRATRRLPRRRGSDRAPGPAFHRAHVPRAGGIRHGRSGDFVVETRAAERKRDRHRPRDRLLDRHAGGLVRQDARGERAGERIAPGRSQGNPGLLLPVVDPAGGSRGERLAGWWWADPVAALLMVPWLVSEGVEGWRGEDETEHEPAEVHSD